MSTIDSNFLKPRLGKPNKWAVLALCLAVLPWLISFSGFVGCSNLSADLSGAVALISISIFVYLTLKRQKGRWLAFLAFCLSSLGFLVLVTLC